MNVKILKIKNSYQIFIENVLFNVIHKNDKKVLADIIDRYMKLNYKVTIENEKQAAITHLKNQVAELSIGIAEKVIKDELSNKDKQIDLIEKMLDDTTLN